MAGRIADPFYADGSLVAIVNKALADGTALDLSGWNPNRATNSFANTHVESIVLEVPHQHPQLRPGARIGAWCATKLATDAGGWRQINRGGHPMMYGRTVAEDLFPDILSYVVGTPATYGFAARNGRTLADNVPEAMYALLSGTAVASGLKPAVALRQPDFPYIRPA